MNWELNALFLQFSFGFRKGSFGFFWAVKARLTIVQAHTLPLVSVGNQLFFNDFTKVFSIDLDISWWHQGTTKRIFSRISP